MKFSNIIQSNRITHGYTIQQVAQLSGIDAALISKIENGKRIASRKQMLTLVNLFHLNHETAISAWLSDKIIALVKDEKYALSAMLVAEEEVKYFANNKNATYPNNLSDLIKKIDELKAEWESKKPLNTTQLRKMREYFDVTYTYESNQIEGNTLTYQETHLVVNEGVTIGGKSMREHLEAINHYEAIDFISDVVKKKEPITERLLKEIHFLILKGIDRLNAGVYRSVPVKIGGSSHTPPEPYLVSKKMEEVFEFYMENKNRIHPVILAADMHEKIVTVHPFIDGNGRTSRLIMNLILLKNGFTITSLKGDYESRMKYYLALENIQTNGNSTDFYKLILNSCIRSLKEHISLAG